MYFMRVFNETVRGSRLDLVFFEDAIISLMKVIGLYAYGIKAERVGGRFFYRGAG